MAIKLGVLGQGAMIFVFLVSHNIKGGRVPDPDFANNRTAGLAGGILGFQEPLFFPCKHASLPCPALINSL